MPRHNEPRVRTLLDGRIVKWCSEYGSWGTHLRADYLTDKNTNLGAAVAADSSNSDAVPPPSNVEANDQVHANLAGLGDHLLAEL